MTEALRFWALIELIGLGAAPLAGLVLARLPGAGLGLGKVLGLLLVTWLVWLGGTSTLVPYGTGSAALWIALVCALGLLAWVRGWDGAGAPSPAGSRAAGSPAAAGGGSRRRAPEPDPLRRRLFWGAEAVFLVAFAGHGAARRLLARRVEHREADGHGVHDGREPRGHVPARRTRGSPAPT